MIFANFLLNINPYNLCLFRAVKMCTLLLSQDIHKIPINLQLDYQMGLLQLWSPKSMKHGGGNIVFAVKMDMM